jgi:hypothetical protein
MTKYNNKTINLENINIKKSNLVVDLFRIFDNFIVNETYPFIQYQQGDGNLVYKFNSANSEKDKNAILNKWFETWNKSNTKEICALLVGPSGI